MNDHKAPADRSHFWERPLRPDEHADRHGAPAVSAKFPMHVHGHDGEFREVLDEAALEAALAEGWALTPPTTPAD